MPGKRWNRKKYPSNWEKISYEFRASKNFTCEFCGYVQGDPLVSKAGNTYRGTVDAAHRFPNRESDPDPDLLCLCKRDHRLYDNSAPYTEWEAVERSHAAAFGAYQAECSLTYYTDCSFCPDRKCKGHDESF